MAVQKVSMMKVLWVLTVLNLVCGCTPQYRNVPLKHYEPDSGYRFDNLEKGDHNSDQLFLCLSFSGGGTRAAALAYGVLQELRDTPIANGPDGQPRNLLDEADIISAVSGGSFPAMGYALWGDELFVNHFEETFLRHNVQRDLVLGNFNPLDFFPWFQPVRDNSYLAASYYNRRIFNEKTYADIKRRPFVVVNATDMTRRKQFQFTQDDFDLLGSDLMHLPVSWAVAASSAIPPVLEPMRLKYYAGDAMSGAIRDTLDAPSDSLLPLQRSPRYRWAQSLIDVSEFQDSGSVRIDERNHRFLYLLDGGLVDNLGMAYILQTHRRGALRQKIEAGKVTRLVVIIVDAGTDPPTPFERSALVPGKMTSGVRSATSGIYAATYLMTIATKHALLEAHQNIQEAYKACRDAIEQQCPDAQAPPPPPEVLVDDYVIGVNFYRLGDRESIEHFSTMPTSFNLKSTDVDDLIAAGRSLLTNHPEFQRLVDDLNRAEAN